MKPRRESGRHRQAFETYFALGQKRSLIVVAEKFKVSATSVGNWSSAFGWQQRLAEREQVIGEIVAERSKAAEVEMRERQLSITRTVQKIFARRLLPRPDGTFEITGELTVSDFIRAAQLELLLMGLPTSREEQVGAGPGRKATHSELLQFVVDNAKEDDLNRPWLDFVKRTLGPGQGREGSAGPGAGPARPV